MRQSNSVNRFQSVIDFLKRIRVPSKIAFFIVGILSTGWFLFRVIPKPSRAVYPCMRAAAPLASSFVTYLLGITSISFFFRRARQHLYQARFKLAVVFIAVGLVAGGWTIVRTTAISLAADNNPQEPQTPNEPIGVGKGIYPGRVVWAYDPDATNENCENAANSGDYWYMEGNTNQDAVSEMLSSSIQQLTGTTSDAEAWDSIFIYYNRNHERGSVNYSPGEKIVIKINMNAINNGNHCINTTPQVCYAVLDHLINVVGVAETDISIGDPNCSMNTQTYTPLHNAFPNVTYWGSGTGLTTAGQTSEPVIYGSDGGYEDPLPQAYVDATYMINIPVFKKHHRAGISLCSKNHFGSIAPYTGGAWHLHYSLPAPETSDVTNGEYGVYRCFVDIMGHKDLGGKTVLYLVDGIWGSTNWGHPAVKWHMTPFNDDWPSSLFLSQDPVAIESVGYDFLYEEFDPDQSETLHPEEGGTWSDGAGPFPHFKGSDDFLHQAADPANWPVGIQYDPEDDGSILGSMGTHEHWNNAIEKKYTRNLGTGDGIELIKIFAGSDYFTPDNSDLLSDTVLSVYVDSFDVKWFGTDMGISRYNGATWSSVTTDNHLLNNDIRDIEYERTSYGHEIWAATAGGLSVMAFNVDGVTSATTYTTGNSDILSNDVVAVGVDIRHNRWAGTPDGLSIYRGSDWYDTTEYMDEDHNWVSFTDITINAIGSYEKDSMAFIATDGDGVLRFDFDLVDGFTGASAYGVQWTPFESNTVNSVTTRDTIQWFGTPEGAFRHDGNMTKQNWTIYPVDSLVDANVTAIEVDDIGNIWFGSDEGVAVKTTSGWIKTPGGTQSSNIVVSTETTSAGFGWTKGSGAGFDLELVTNGINDIKKDFSGNIWIATNGGVVYYGGDPSPKRIVFVKEGSSGSPAPVKGTTYTANSEFGSGSEVSGWYCVYSGIGDTVNISGLTADTEYRVAVLEFYGTEGDEIYSTETAENNPVNFTTQEGPGTSVDPLLERDVNVYPVPFSDYLMISGSGLNEGMIVSFYNTAGKLYHKYTITGEMNRINTSGLEKGIYILNINDGNKNYNLRVVKH